MCLYVQYVYYILSDFLPRPSQRHSAFSSIVNQRSPLMVSLFPSPKERSPHLFLGSRAKSQSPLQPEPCDTKSLTEQLSQQLASVRWCLTSWNMSHLTFWRIRHDSWYDASVILLLYSKCPFLLCQKNIRFKHHGAPQCSVDFQRVCYRATVRDNRSSQPMLI